MSEPNAAESTRPADAIGPGLTEGFDVDPTGDDEVDRKLAAIEMAGEEVAAGWKPSPHKALAPEVRYLHSSRTIHQLITDRNRSVGIFLFVASLAVGASTAILNVDPAVVPIIPLSRLQYWCFPVTFGVLAGLAGFISLILIRTRIGLIYEVTKMNVLLGIPSTRVERVNPLSIFYLMHLLVAVLGGASAGFTLGMILGHFDQPSRVAVGAGVGGAFVYVLGLQIVYYLTILRATSEARLGPVRG